MRLALSVEKTTSSSDRDFIFMSKSLDKELLFSPHHEVFNCGSWLEYEIRRQKVFQELQEKGPAWTGEFRTDVCTKGERAEWFQSDQYPGGINEHWLYHGTSGAGESGITEGDFRLNLAGSNAGTLYGARLSLNKCRGLANSKTDRISQLTV